MASNNILGTQIHINATIFQLAVYSDCHTLCIWINATVIRVECVRIYAYTNVLCGKHIGVRASGLNATFDV